VKNKIIAFVVSYNRPLQLDLCLKSLRLHCTDYEKLDVQVLYKSDILEATNFYPIVSKENPNVVLTPEAMFQTNVNIALMDYTYVLFITDDSIFIRDFSISEIIKFLKKNKNVLGFSLRLGLNLNYCYSLDQPQLLPICYLDGDIVTWEWSKETLDWGYPIEVSSSVYRVEQIQEILNSLQYYPNPNVLEWLMDRNKNIFLEKFPLMACYQDSVAFADPINKVNDDNQNRSGHNQKYATNILLYRYGEGIRIDPNQFNSFIPNACHCEVAFKEIEK
jgi:hypothetical protein